MDLIKSRESRGHIAQVLLNSIFCPNWLDNTLGQILFSLLDLVVTTSLSVREVWGSRLGPVKSDTVLPGTRHRGCFLRTWKLSCLGAQRWKRAPLLITRFGGIPRV